MKYFKLICLVFILIIGLRVSAQENDPPQTELSGYIKYLHTEIIPALQGLETVSDNFFHNRLNFFWHLSENWTFKTAMRNRFFWGELVESQPSLFRSLENDPGFLDLSSVWALGDRFAFHSILDRFNFSYHKDDWELIVGRERINWGMTLIWNPNDIFNTYAFFDFDYEERPGTDAITVNYFTSPTGQLGLSYASGRTIMESTWAVRYRWSTGAYDIQGFLGYQNEYYVLGAGWAGNIQGAGFRGEGTYFISSTDLHQNQFIGAIDFDYAFSK